MEHLRDLQAPPYFAYSYCHSTRPMYKPRQPMDKIKPSSFFFYTKLK